ALLEPAVLGRRLPRRRGRHALRRLRRPHEASGRARDRHPRHRRRRVRSAALGRRRGAGEHHLGAGRDRGRPAHPVRARGARGGGPARLSVRRGAREGPAPGPSASAGDDEGVDRLHRPALPLDLPHHPLRLLDLEPVQLPRHRLGRVQHTAVGRAGCARAEVVDVVPEHEHPAARGERGRRPREQLPPLRRREVQEEDDDEVVRRRLRPVAAHVRLHPVDVDAALAGRSAGERERRVREVDARHLPAALGQPERVPAGAAGEVERPAGRRLAELRRQDVARVVADVRRTLLPAAVPVLALHAEGIHDAGGPMVHGSDRFRDRAEAGRLLAERLGGLGGGDVVVLGLPRGGVPVAREVARALGAPLDVFLVRKLGLPGQPELAMGAIASGGTRVLNEELVDELRLPPEVVDAVAERERAELERRERAYRGDRPPLPLAGRTVLLVDDGLATGSSMRAAIAAVRARRPRRVVVAVPVAPRHTLDELRPLVDELVCLAAPEPFHAVGLWYADFAEVSDEEVRRAVDGGAVDGDLALPPGARGLVLFAHGSGSSRLSPRNRLVAGVLEQAGLATFLLDLLTREEEELDRRGGELRFDVELLAGRLAAAADWLAADAGTAPLPLGLFGASTGAAAALIVAARRPELVRAVVSRG